MKRVVIDVSEAARLYSEEGLTLKTIGERMGVSPQVVSHRLYEAGVPTRGSLHRTEWFDVERAVDMYLNEGMSMPDIAAEMWVSTSKVNRELLKAGIIIANKKERRGRRVDV